MNLVKASQLINFGVMCFAFIRFKKAQGLDRKTLPYKGFCQPYATSYGLTGCFVMTFVGGYTVFLKSNRDVPTLLFS